VIDAVITDEQLSPLVYDLIWTHRPKKTDLWLKRGINRIPRKNLVDHFRKKGEKDPNFERHIHAAYRKHLSAVAARDAFLKVVNHKEYIESKTQFPLEPGETNHIGWVVACYNEPDYVSQCLESIRQNDSGPILLINDGGDETGLQEIADSVGAKFVNGERLKNLRDGHNWWKRFFTLGLELGTDYLVKLDPDSYFWRPLRNSLKGLTFFGTTNDFAERNPHTVQGGAQGFSRAYAERVLADDMTARPRIKAIGPDKIRFTTDGYLCDMNEEMGVLGEEWKEVNSVYSLRQELPDSEPGTFAITHPHTLGVVAVSPHHSARLDICYACPSFNIDTRICKENGVYIYPKTKIPNETCPLGKWDLPTTDTTK